MGSLLGSELSEYVFIAKIKSILLSNVFLSDLYRLMITIIENLSAKSFFTIDLDGFERKNKQQANQL